MTEETLNEIVKFRVTRQEKEQLKLAARRLGWTLSEYIRFMVLDVSQARSFKGIENAFNSATAEYFERLEEVGLVYEGEEG